MNKHLTFISFMIAMIIIVAHDAIHHHHSGLADIEFSWPGGDEHHGDNDKHHNHFPAHQHLLSEGDFMQGRNPFPVLKITRVFQHDIFLTNVPVITDVNNYSGFLIISQDHLCLSPLIISLNKIRGSPLFS